MVKHLGDRPGMISVRARNCVNKKPYRAINALLLNNMDFEYPLYMTFLQAKERGGNIKKGSKSIEVIYWKTLEFENEDKVKNLRPAFQLFRFHLDNPPPSI